VPSPQARQSHTAKLYGAHDFPQEVIQPKHAFNKGNNKHEPHIRIFQHHPSNLSL
jgi:hypothetical protein